MAAAIASASNAAALSDIRYFTQRGIFSGRILDRMGIARLRDDLDDLSVTNPALAERLTAALEALRETVRETVSQALLLYGREEAENLRNEILRNAPLSRIEPRQVEQMRLLIRQIARRLRERYSKPRKRQRRGHLDVRRTIRRNAAWGGVPFLTAWKRRRRDRPKIVALCDVSGSVARVSDFFLLLIHSLHEVVSDVRSFAFSGHLIEVSGILESRTPEAAMQEIMSKVGFGSSDYGNSFADFEKQWMSAVTQRTTVIVLGDARSNNLDPRAEILRRIAERSKRLVWLNPEGRMAWGWAIPKCRAMRRSAPWCANAPPLSSSSARCRTSWRPTNRQKARRPDQAALSACNRRAIIRCSVPTDLKFSGVISDCGIVKSNSASTPSIRLTMSIEVSPISASRESGSNSTTIEFCSRMALTSATVRL